MRDTNFKHGSEGNVISHFEKTRRRVTMALSALVLLGAVGCSDDVPPVFEIPGTGSVEGLLFLDTNRDGLFDPSAGDRALSNVGVSLVSRGTDDVIANTSTTTNASGRFSITDVPVGSHALKVDTAGVGAGVSFCQNPIPVTVFVNESQFAEVAARGGCIIVIADAQDVGTGKPATIRGTVTAAPGQLGAARMYVQDETGAIRIDGANLGGQTVAVGDVVEISGTLGFTSGEFSILNGKLNERVAGTAIVPAEVTTQQITDAAKDINDPLNGTLVVVRKARLDQIWGGGEPSTRNAKLTDGSGITVLRIESSVISFPNASDVVPGLSNIVALGKCYDIIGIGSNFNATGELFPRTLSDITEVPCS